MSNKAYTQVCKTDRQTDIFLNGSNLSIKGYLGVKSLPSHPQDRRPPPPPLIIDWVIKSWNKTTNEIRYSEYYFFKYRILHCLAIAQKNISTVEKQFWLKLFNQSKPNNIGYSLQFAGIKSLPSYQSLHD